MASVYVAAAICGVWHEESGINPGIWESLTPCDWNYEYEYTGVGGYGLGQWTNVGSQQGRCYKLHDYVTSHGYSDGDGVGQMDYFIYEQYWANLSNVGGSYSTLSEFLQSNSTDLSGLVWDFIQNWEGCDPTNYHQARYSWALTLYDYINSHKSDDPSNYTWKSYNGYISENDMYNNSMCVYFALNGYSTDSEFSSTNASSSSTTTKNKWLSVARTLLNFLIVTAGLSDLKQYLKYLGSDSSSSSSYSLDGVFSVRTTSPASEPWSKFYNSSLYNTGYGYGWVQAVLGSYNGQGDDPNPTCNVMPNCVGYAQGRMIEVYCELSGCTWDSDQTFGGINNVQGNGGQWVSAAQAAGLQTGNDAVPGSVLSFTDSYGAGHVVFVESVSDDGNSIVITESGYGGPEWNMQTLYKNSSGTWDYGGNFVYSGFIYMPGYTKEQMSQKSSSGTASTTSDSYNAEVSLAKNSSISNEKSGYSTELTTISATKNTKNKEVTYESVTTTIRRDKLVTTDSNVVTHGTSLLSYPTRVESPYVYVNIAGVELGSYQEKYSNKKLVAKFPNYINSMTVTKVNGTVNQYTINLTNQIVAGNDPNYIDKLLSKVGYGSIYITYGDWMAPTFSYKQEKAIITNVTSNVDFSNSAITYTISATGDSLQLLSTTFNFPAKKAKPSNLIKSMLTDARYKLYNMFPGMTKAYNVAQLIPDDDKVIELEAKPSTSVLNYLNYLVSCMTPSIDGDGEVLKSACYYLSIFDDTENNYGGTYFKITKVSTKNNSETMLSSLDTYEVDVGFAGDPANKNSNDNNILSFNITTNNSWALLYEYTQNSITDYYSYTLDDDGKYVATYSPNYAKSASNFKMNADTKNWWTNMTQFPITAELEIKGLLRPSMLMSYVRINSLFYGIKHNSSGLYIITKQEDTISGNGYRTKLTLQRIAGDQDIIKTVEDTVTTKVPVVSFNYT